METAVKAHPTLFTRIELNGDGEPNQTIDLDKETWALAIENIDDIEQKKAELVQPFNIHGDRLFHNVSTTDLKTVEERDARQE